MSQKELWSEDELYWGLSRRYEGRSVGAAFVILSDAYRRLSLTCVVV